MCCNIVSRVRVTGDNDWLFAVSRYPQGLPPERQRSMIDLRVMEEVKKNQRRSMAVGPFEDLPPHLRNHLVSNIFLGFITPPFVWDIFVCWAASDFLCTIQNAISVSLIWVGCRGRGLANRKMNIYWQIGCFHKFMRGPRGKFQINPISAIGRIFCQLFSSCQDLLGQGNTRMAEQGKV